MPSFYAVAALSLLAREATDNEAEHVPFMAPTTFENVYSKAWTSYRRSKPATSPPIFFFFDGGAYCGDRSVTVKLGSPKFVYRPRPRRELAAGLPRAYCGDWGFTLKMP